MIADLSHEVVIRPALKKDAPAVAQLIKPYVAERMLLPRTLKDLRRLTTNGFVAEAQGRVVGFAAVDIYSKKLSELVCLAVAADCQHRGIGKRLVHACVERARAKKVLELMAITAAEHFFKACGFDYSLPCQKKALFADPKRMAIEHPDDVEPENRT